MLLSIAYFPPVEYFAALASGMTLSDGRVIPSEAYIEACENYQKQSYRNRCHFYAENGIQSMNVPVIHENGTYALPITEIKVDYKTPWVIRSQRTIESAYFSSPFFEYYKDDLFAILDSKPERLFDLNMQIINFFIKKIGLPCELRLTDIFTAPDSGEFGRDLRNVIHPKKTNSLLDEMKLNKPYYQVFSQKHGFIPNLSIMDLLFNEGPESIKYLARL